MRIAPLVIMAVGAWFLVPTIHADGGPLPIPEAPMVAAGCAPPCGPIVVSITILAEKSQQISLDDKDVFETKGVVQYTFDVDNEGYSYDPAKEIWIEFRVMKTPDWLKTTITPPRVQVPIRPDQCPTCVQPDGDPTTGNMMYFFEAPIAVKIEKLREPTRAEVEPWIRSDGMYRVSISGASNESFADVAGNKPAGLYEGYGPKDFKIIPPEPEPAAQFDGGQVPGLGGLALLGVLAVAALVGRRF